MGNKIIDFKQYIKDRIKIDSNGCWIWQKLLDNYGYGRCTSNIKKGYEATHRVSYRAYVTNIQPGMHIIHSCDTPACVNPAHLREGTHQDNMDDKVKRGRCNTALHKLTKLRRNGWVITPYGKFTCMQKAADKEQVDVTTIHNRLHNGTNLKYYRERYDGSHK